MSSFGELLRLCRRQSRDPVRGGLLTQERLGELLGEQLGDAGYSGAAVSDWERDKSKISEDDRLVLCALIAILHRCGGLQSPDEANALLQAGNYRPLLGAELARSFPGLAVMPAPEPPAGSPGTPAAPAAAPPSPHRQNLLVLLAKVKQFWVQGVLERSVADAALIDMTRERLDAAIDHPWRGIVDTASRVDAGAAHLSTLVELYRQADRALLILGGPGAGKTTTLLTLARDLIHLAEKDASQPIPVILNLASWAEKRPPLAQWVLEELTAKYQIPRALGAIWLENNELMLLLDGLDEVREKHRAGCIAAINRFRELHGLTGLVICCRENAYQAQAVRLRLGGAIAIRPLKLEQIDTYLLAGGPRLAALRTAVQQDDALLEMARSPLMLSVMAATYGDDGHPDPGQDARPRPPAPPGRLASGAIVPAAQEHVFAAYVRRMISRRRTEHDYPAEQALQWLAWLAQMMAQHDQSVFLLERLQPSWLPGSRWRWLYLLLSRLLMGFFIGLLMWLAFRLRQQFTPQFTFAWLDVAHRRLPFTRAASDAVWWLALNLLLGLAVALLHGFRQSRFEGRPGRSRLVILVSEPHPVVTGLVVALVTFVLLIPYDSVAFALNTAVQEGAFFALAFLFGVGRDARSEIRTVEALSWSWIDAAKGLLPGVAVGVAFGLMARQVVGYTYVIRINIAAFGLFFFLLGGLRRKRLEAKSWPNQGIWLSLTNGLWAAGIFGALFGLLYGLVANPRTGVIAAVYLALGAGLVYGGFNVISHYLLRLLLWLYGAIPWRTSRYLDHAARHVLLHRVGGGYIFIHRLFQDYFARTAVTANGKQ